MHSDEKKQWEYSFDLNQELLRIVYGKRSHTYAYTEIQNYLFKNGFDNKDDKQGSCYFTSVEMRQSTARRIIRDMYHTFPWLSECLSKDSLYIKPEKDHSFSDYRKRLNNSKKHFEELEEYYNKNGISMPLKLKVKFAKTKIDTSGRQNIHKTLKDKVK